MDDFIEYKSAVVAPATMKKFRQSAEKFKEVFGASKDIRDITANEAKNYPRVLKKLGNGRGKPYADSTVAKLVGIVKELFQWAVSEAISLNWHHLPICSPSALPP